MRENKKHTGRKGPEANGSNLSGRLSVSKHCRSVPEGTISGITSLCVLMAFLECIHMWYYFPLGLCYSTGDHNPMRELSCTPGKGMALDMKVIQPIRLGEEPGFPGPQLALLSGTHPEHKYWLSSLWGHSVNKLHPHSRFSVSLTPYTTKSKATPWGLRPWMEDPFARVLEAYQPELKKNGNMCYFLWQLEFPNLRQSGVRMNYIP